MNQTTAKYLNLSGTPYEVGEQLANWVKTSPELLQKVLLPNSLPEASLDEINVLLDSQCEGVREEIKGFAETLQIELGQVMYYAMTYLERGCSLMGCTPQKSMDGHTLLAFTFDFNDKLEDIALFDTAINGKYRHTGSVSNLFGRSNGMNEHGLSICQASNGMPVGNFEGGLKSAVTGLHFWAIIRNLLETCKTVTEALSVLDETPIGYNMNLMLADSTGTITLFETLAGKKAYKTILKSDEKGYLCATNHTVLYDLQKYETGKLKNSVHRLDLISKLFETNDKVSKSDMQKLITMAYPEGLCCHYYQGFFGLLNTAVFDITEKSIEISFGSPQRNPWRKFMVGQNYSDNSFDVILPYEAPPEGFYDII